MKNIKLVFIISLFLITPQAALSSVADVLEAAGISTSQETTYNFLKSSGIQETGEKIGYETRSGAELSIPVMVKLALNAIFGLLGVIFMILMLYGGYKWMLARGNEQEVEAARDIITRAITGLIIISMSYIITFFVFKALG